MSSSPAHGDGVSRRTFLRGGAAAVAGSALLPGLAACGKGPAAQVSSAKQVKLPTYQPFNGPAPDIAGSANGVPPVYYSYPASPVRSVASPPLAGETISAVTNLYFPPPPGVGSNPAWAEIQKRLGATVNINMVDATDYPTKFATLVASGNLPDIMLYLQGSINDFDAFLQTQIADLTPYLGGDAITKYPNLAAIPEVFWTQCTAAGKLYFLPIPRNVTAGAGFYNQTAFAKVGATDSQSIRDLNDFTTLCKELTRPGSGKYALSAYNGYLTAPVTMAYRVPFNWEVQGGKLVKDYETEQFTEAVAYSAKLYKAGVFMPGSVGWASASQGDDALAAGKVAYTFDGFPAYPKIWTNVQQTSPGTTVLPFVPFGATGGKGIVYQDNVMYGNGVMLKKQSPDKIRAALELANFLAAPFGTEEYLLIYYGVEGKDYTMKNGSPVLTSKGNLDITVPWKYIEAPELVLFADPATGGKPYVNAAHQALSTLIPMAVPDPTITYFSPTSANSWLTLYTNMQNATNQIISGRQPVSSLKTAIKQWRQQGGDKMRAEFEKAMA